MREEVVGVIPAAGKGTRLFSLPFSKELFPLGYEELQKGSQSGCRPRVASQFIIERMKEAGIRRIFIIVGPGKQDISEHYGNGHRFDVDIVYLFQEELRGMPAALDLVRPWLNGEVVAFGMPDTIIHPSNVFSLALEHHLETRADLTLGLFPTTTPSKFGMVQVLDGRPVRCIDKPAQTDLTYMWGIACWSSKFVAHLMEFTTTKSSEPREILLSDAFQAAINAGHRVGCVLFDRGEYIDIGTPADLLTAVARFGSAWCSS